MKLFSEWCFFKTFKVLYKFKSVTNKNQQTNETHKNKFKPKVIILFLLKVKCISELPLNTKLYLSSELWYKLPENNGGHVVWKDI